MPKLTERGASGAPKRPSGGAKHVWTSYPKIMGNLIPALIAVPFAVYGLTLMSSNGVVLGRGLWFFAGSPIVLWLAMNFLGLFRNGAMRSLLAARLTTLHPELGAVLAPRSIRAESPKSGSKNPKSKIQNLPWFVGVATPKHTSLLDPHEDIGFLIVHPDRLQFLGDHLSLMVEKNDVSAVQFRMNPHTLVGLGRWVSVEGQSGGQRIRLQIEPRERSTLMANMLLSAKLKRTLQQWLKEK